MTIRQLIGDCRVELAALEPESVQAVITSPPYYSLRDYGVEPLVWGGDHGHAHEWGAVSIEHAATYQAGEKARWNHRVNGRGEAQERILAKEPGWTRKDVELGQHCPCGAWLGSLGLEPSPEAFVEHLVEVFRAVRRVLKPDGVLWVNLGDSYAGSGKGPSNSLNKSNPHSHLAGEAMRLQQAGPQEHTIGLGRVPGVKPKSLLEMPSKLAIALEADGWYERVRIPWLKRNCMPESADDRPTNAVEYVFLLSKSRTYHWDADAVRVAQGNNTHSRGNGHTPKERPMGEGVKANASFHAATNGVVVPGGRNRRNSDWFFESWQGLMIDDAGGPLAFIVNPRPFSGTHFATFPPHLVDPMIRASTRPGDTVLDPFGGAGTVGLVADRLGRDAVLIDLKPDYADMARERLVGDAPMFVEMTGGGHGHIA